MNNDMKEPKCDPHTLYPDCPDWTVYKHYIDTDIETLRTATKQHLDSVYGKCMEGDKR